VMINLVRWILIGTLLWVVWHHAHWSVALTLTGLAISNEFTAMTDEMRNKKL
jgi:hypothetical protein